MAPTSDECREMAERLRSGIIARNIQEAYVAIVQSIGVRPCLLSHAGESGDRFDRSAYELALNRLADLIDPTCHIKLRQSDSDLTDEPHFVCSRCGKEIDVFERRDYYTLDGIVRHADYCKFCGARVVDNDGK